MNKFTYFLLLTLVLVSCGTDGQHFKIDGRLLHLNQGEFYVYSPDGDLDGMDTIKVEAGRFTYEVPCGRPMTLMIVFPNYTEQPVFAEPGKTVDVDGSASNLKELKVTGTKENKLMNSFREQIAGASPPEMVKYARQFVEDHPESAVGSYLVRKYFIQTAMPDYAAADKMLALMQKHQPGNGYISRMRQQIKGLDAAAIGKTVPAFSAYDIDGKSVSNATLSERNMAVVFAWASWSYESVGALRQIAEMRKESQGRFSLIGVCVDANVDECRRSVRNSGIDCPVICDGDMVGGRVYRVLGLSSVPDNIIVENGRITGRNLDLDELKEKLGNQ